MFSKYSLHNLHGQSIQSHFLTLSLKWAGELICLKFSSKIDHNCRDLQFKVSNPFLQLFFFSSQTHEYLQDYTCYFPFQTESHWLEHSVYSLFYKSQLSEFECFYGDCKCHWGFATVYQSHLYGHLVLIPGPTHEFCWSFIWFYRTSIKLILLWNWKLN